MKFIKNKNCKPFLYFNFLFYFFILDFSYAASDKISCEYETRSGKRIVVDDFRLVPRVYRDNARCVKLDEGSLASVKDINLKRDEANDVVYTSLGNVNLKWAKDVKGLLGKNPKRVIGNAMNVVSKIISSTSLNQKLSNMNIDWNIVFMGKDIPNNQIPSYLITNCHPGWMVPPSDIYIAANSVYKGCNGNSNNEDADSELEQVLLHELGHAIEYRLLNNRNIRDLKRSEGFATWFAIYAAGYSSNLDKGKLLSYYQNLAKTAIHNSPNVFNFSGSAYDYARASMYFYKIEQKQGVGGIIRLYDEILSGKSFLSVVANLLNTSEDKIESKLDL